MICPKCGKEIETNYCPFCEFEFNKENEDSTIGYCDKNSDSSIYAIEINRNIFSYKGRIERNDFAKYVLMTMLISVILACADGLGFKPPAFLYLIFLTPIILITMFATSKRLRDIGWSQWLLLLFFLGAPVLLLIFQALLLAVPGKYNDSIK